MARKGENIYKRKDGRWEGRYIKSRSSTGKANYGYVYAKSYREVKAKLISQSSCTSNSVTVDPEISSDQFEQVAMEWFQAICPKVKESTSNKYRNLLSSYILPVFGSKQLRDITHERIQDRTNSEYKTRIVVTTPKSACSIRTIPVPHGLMTILTAHKASSTGYILTNSDQNPLEPRTMQNHFKKVLKNSGITSANYHSLRHTFATRCIELGFDVKSLSEILGHASVNITMNRYVHPSMDLKRENMQRLSDLLAVK